MRMHRALVTICVPVMLTVWPVHTGQVLDVPGHVDKASQLLLSPDTSARQCTDGLVSLLDAIAGAARSARITGTWPAKIVTARELVASGRSLTDDTVSLLHDSYRAVHGKSFKVPANVRSLADAREHLRGQLSSVRGLLDQGEVNEAIRRMLEAAVMIVTPLEA